MSIQIAKEAIRLSSLGITVIPTSGKKPMISGWNDLRGTTRDQIEEWTGEGKWRNIAMVCGEASGNIVVIDFDGSGGYDLFKEKFPELVDTKTVATGSGVGYHVYFKCELLPDSLGVMGIVIPDTGEKINIEFRANNCLATLPPSVHPDTQKPYTYFVDKPTKQVSDLSAVIAWAKSLKPESVREGSAKKRPKSDTDTLEREINPKLLEAVEDYFMAQPHTIHKEWINVSCPNPSIHAHGDKNFSFSYNPSIAFAKCYVCGDMYLKEILPLIGIQARDFGGFYKDQLESEPQTQLDRMPSTAQAQPPIPPATTPAPTTAGIPVVTRSSRLTNYVERLLDYDRPVEYPPVMFPLKALHSFGGMAQVVKPGKLIGIVGISGGGKTSLLETMVDGFLNYHAPSLVWSPEWSPDEFIERSVQRYGGPSATEVYLHETFIWEQQNGIKNGGGRELSRERIEDAKTAIRLLRRWEDEVGYLRMPFLTADYLKSAISDTLKTISFKPRVLVIDYLQLLHALEPNHYVTMYSLIMQIKMICEQYGLVGVISSQVTKDDTRGVAKSPTKRSKPQLLDASSARYVNDDGFNLFITINPEFDAGGVKQDSVILNIAKSSIGKSGKVRVGVDWSHLSFEEEPHKWQGNLDGKDEETEDEEEETEKA